VASIDDKQKALNKRIKEILDREARFDNPEWILTRDIPMIRRILKNYRKQLRNALGSFIGSGAFEDMVDEAVDEFIKNAADFIEKGKIKTRNAERNKLLRAVKKEYASLMGSSVDNMVARQLQKSTVFNIRADLARIPETILKQTDQIQAVGIRVGGKGKIHQFEKNELFTVWEQLQNRYGTHDQVIFKGGHKKPLNTYVDGRTVTTRTEIDIATNQITAAANGVYFGIINKTGTRDSCIFNEGRTVFMTESARRQYKALNPSIDVSGIKTVAEVKEDDTHTFSFGCKHRVLPSGFQFFDNKEQDEIIKENKEIPTEPKKISETEVKRDIEAGKFAV